MVPPIRARALRYDEIAPPPDTRCWVGIPFKLNAGISHLSAPNLPTTDGPRMPRVAEADLEYTRYRARIDLMGKRLRGPEKKVLPAVVIFQHKTLFSLSSFG